MAVMAKVLMHASIDAPKAHKGVGMEGFIVNGTRWRTAKDFGRALASTAA